MLFQYTLTRWEPGQTFGPKEQYTSGVCNYSLLKTCQARRSGFALVRLKTSQGRTAWATGKPWESVTFVDSGGQCFVPLFLFPPIYFSDWWQNFLRCFRVCHFHFFIEEKKKQNFLSSVSHTRSLTCRYSLTEETLRLTGWREVVGSGRLWGYRACCWSRRMRCTECGFWLEFPADPERWASCRSPSASPPPPPPPAPGVLSLLLLYYMGIVRRLVFLCNLFFLLRSYLFLYFVCPFLLYTLSVCNFPFFKFDFLCIFLCLFGFFFLLGRAVSLCFTWRSDTILLMWCHSNAEGWRLVVWVL